ncbi:MAG: hypothetical protein RLZZ56_808 [Actinomycetota bacterium]|jgi:transcriptional regulator with XRE-family HTH domain
MTEQANLGPKIRDLRKRKGLTQSEFAAVGLSSGYMSLIESGRRNPSKKALDKISGLLGVDLTEEVEESVRHLPKRDLTLLLQVDLAIKIGDLEAANTLFDQIDPSSRNDHRVKVREAELDQLNGKFLSAELILKGFLPELLLTNLSEEKWRAINLYASVSASISNHLEAIFNLFTYRELIDEQKDRELYLLMCCILATRFAELGDFGSAKKLLTELGERPDIENFPRIAARKIWAQADLFFDEGQYEKAGELALSAQRLLESEGVRELAQTVEFLRINCLLMNSELTQNTVELEIEHLEQTIRQSTYGSRQGEVQATVLLIELYIKISSWDNALGLALDLSGADTLKSVDEAYVSYLVARCQFEQGDHASAERSLARAITITQALTKTVPATTIVNAEIRLALDLESMSLARKALGLITTAA